MKEFNEALDEILESAFRESLKIFEDRGTDASLSDLYVKYAPDTSEIFIYDDTENELYNVSVETTEDTDDEDFEEELVDTAKEVLKRLEKSKVFERDFIYKPFSVNLVDADFLVKEELLFLDDENIKIDGNLLSGVNKDLDDFIKKLLD